MQTFSKRFPKLLFLLIVVLLFTAFLCACNGGDDTTVVKQVNLTVEGGYIGENPFSTSTRVYSGVSVTVTAVVRANTRFDCWVDGSGTMVSTDNPYRFTITQDTSLTARFRDASPRSLTVEGGYINGDDQCTQAQFETGTSVIVSAVVANDKVFSHWLNEKNASVSQDNPYTFVLSENTILTAVLLDKEELLVAVVGGYIGEDPTCTSASFYTGDTVSVVATPPQGKRFVAWKNTSGELLSTEAEYSFTLIKNISLVAVYEPIKHTVKLEKGYINGNPDCTELSVDYGASVTLYASEQEGATFLHWVDDKGVEISQHSPYIVEVVSDLSYTAVYQKSIVSVSVSGGIIDAGGTQARVEYDTQVTVTAQAPQGKVFESWLINGTTTSTANPYTFNVTENTVFIARFIDETVLPDPITYTLSVTNGTADVSGAIEENTLVTLTANADTPKSVFMHWEVNGENVGSNRQYSFNITSNTRAIAVFKSIITLSVIDGDTTENQDYDGGDTVNLSASGTDPEKPFLCWYSDDGKIISNDRDCEFIINKSSVVRAIYADKQREEGKVNVVIYGGAAYTYVNNAKGELIGREFQLASSTTVYLTSDRAPSSAVSVVGTIFKPFAQSGKSEIASANQSLPVYVSQGDVYIVYSFTNSYSVTVENGKHADGQSGSVVYPENAIVTATADNIKDKVFEYWTLNGEYYSDSATVEWIATSRATLRAVYSDLYTVNVNGGGVIKDTALTSTQVKNGDVVTVTVTSEDTKLKTFRRWVNAQGEVLSSQRDYTFKVSQDTTVIAEYIYGYTVSVVNGTIDGVEGGIYTQDTAHTIKAAVLEGKRFKGWTANGINVSNSTETMIIVITQDVVFEAVYYDEWTVTKNSADAFIVYENEEIDFVRVIDGSSVTIGAKAKDGYYFDGWNITTDSNVIKISSDHPAIREENGRYYYVYIVSASCTITPIYSPIITVTIKNEDAAGGERVVESREGNTIVLTASTADPTKKFINWTVGVSKITKNPYTYTVGADNITITAHYNDLYKLTLENGKIVGGEFDGQSIGYFEYNTLVMISAAPEQGYRFKHWKNDSGGIISELVETFRARITSTTNYYAEVVRVYTVTVKDKTSDRILHTKQLDTGGDFSYTAPQKDGARFGYWLVNGEQKNDEKCSITNITSDVLIEAVYIFIAQITVQNIDGRGTSSQVYIRDYGASFSTAVRTTPSAITGMTFLGWSVNGVLDTTANGDTYIIESVSEDVVLAPVYKMLYSQKAVVGYEKSINNMQGFADYYQTGVTRGKAFVVPGLSTNESFVIQGIDYSETLNWTFVTGYISPANTIAKHSMVFVLDMSQKDSVSGNYGKLIKEIFLENESGAVYTGHAGGIAVSENNLWISNSKKLFYINLDTIVNTQSTSVMRFAGSVAVPVNSSYCTFADGILWVGEFELGSNSDYATDSTHHNSSNDKLTAWTVGYILNESGAAGYDATTGLKLESGVATPDYVLWHIEKIQGMTIAGNKVVLSQSYGRTNNSTIYIYNNEVYGSKEAKSDGTVTINGKAVPYWLLDSTTQTISAPSMTEDIAVYYEKQSSSLNTGKYYVMVASESASYKYNGADKTSMSKNPTDLVWYLEIAQ